MHLQKPLFFICCLFLSALVSSQKLYQPRSVKQTYENGTRSEDGKPGKNYWQNKGVYDIHLTVNPPKRTIYGTEKISYTNNGPDTLKVLNYKLYLNQHKPGAARLHPASPDYLTAGTHIDTYTENGVQQKWQDHNDGTNKTVKLTKPLPPNQSVNLSFKWHFDMSKQSGREGAIDSTTFFLAYFYPRVAVYDDYEGWDRMTFTGSQEFYNDFNDYTFQVTVPKNYIVWATGDLLNPKEVLQKKYADRLAKSMKSDEVVKIAHQQELKNKEVTQQAETNTWKWKADDITDVAIAISDHYNWDAGSVVVDNKTGRRASVQSAYDEKAKDFQKMVEYGKHSLKWFSTNDPGVPYPFQKTTIVRGFADMEYPMMVNDNSHPEKPDFTRFVVEHEIAHSYFPFYMGTNETRFGFMDEGWAVTFEYLIGIADLGDEQATKNYQGFRVNRWIHDPSMEEDIPIITPTNVLSGPAMGNNEYGKASLGYLAVKDLLGEKLFKKALHGYMDRWNGKHPIPWDFFYSFNNISKKDLNWFWDSWFFSNNYIDVGIEKVKTKRDRVEITLKNIGGMPAPVDVVLTMKDGKTKTFHQTPVLWKDNISEALLTLKGVKNIAEISLEGGIWMDADPSNNSWKK